MRSVDAITLLEDDHRTVEQLFKRFEKAGERALGRNDFAELGETPGATSTGRTARSSTKTTAKTAKRTASETAAAAPGSR